MNSLAIRKINVTNERQKLYIVASKKLLRFAYICLDILKRD